jgi:hypothetical protein
MLGLHVLQLILTLSNDTALLKCDMSNEIRSRLWWWVSRNLEWNSVVYFEVFSWHSSTRTVRISSKAVDIKTGYHPKASRKQNRYTSLLDYAITININSVTTWRRLSYYLFIFFLFYVDNYKHGERWNLYFQTKWDKRFLGWRLIEIRLNAVLWKFNKTNDVSRQYSWDNEHKKLKRQPRRAPRSKFSDWHRTDVLVRTRLASVAEISDLFVALR